MNKYKLTRQVLGIFMVFVLFFGNTSSAQAQLISNKQIENQNREVLLAVVVATEKHLNLLQMIFIQRLEAQVKHLQAIADNQ